MSMAYRLMGNTAAIVQQGMNLKDMGHGVLINLNTVQSNFKFNTNGLLKNTLVNKCDFIIIPDPVRNGSAEVQTKH